MSVIVKGHLIMPKDELRECKRIASNNQLSFPLKSLFMTHTISLILVLTEKGVHLNQPTVCYCNSGMSSCSVVMAIIYCGGQARLYSVSNTYISLILDNFWIIRISHFLREKTFIFYLFIGWIQRMEKKNIQCRAPTPKFIK